MRGGPLPLRDVLAYLKLEDGGGDELVPGSVIYLGTHGDAPTHYWSYPSSAEVRWAALGADRGLGMTDEVPDQIKARTPALDAHKVRRERPAPAPLPHNTTGKPRWVASSLVGSASVEYVAKFDYAFSLLAQRYGARPTLDKDGGGAGPTRMFFVQLTNDRLALFECEQRHAGSIRLYLQVSAGGRVDWEDYEEVMNPLGVALETVFRQGGLVWRRRRPTPQGS